MGRAPYLRQMYRSRTVPLVGYAITARLALVKSNLHMVGHEGWYPFPEFAQEVDRWFRETYAQGGEQAYATETPTV